MAETVDDLYCLMVPVADARLLLPNTAVAEVVGYSSVRSTDSEPDWLVGDVAWEDRRVPLFSYEAACGDVPPEPSPRSRVALFYNIGERLDHDYLALVTQGHPHLVRVERGIVELLNSAAGEDTAVLCHIKVGGSPAVIPDLTYFEKLLASHSPRTEPQGEAQAPSGEQAQTEDKPEIEERVDFQDEMDQRSDETQAGPGSSGDPR